MVTNAVVAWTTEYYGLAVESMRAAGRRVDDEVLAHISPAHSENINSFGTIDVDIDGELAQLDPSGYRPLRASRSIAVTAFAETGPGRSTSSSLMLLIVLATTSRAQPAEQRVRSVP